MNRPTLILAATVGDGQIVAHAAGLQDVSIVTPQTPVHEGRVLSALVVTPAFAMRLAENDVRAYETLLIARRDALRCGVVI